MMQDWTLRRCASCGILETDLRAVLVVNQLSAVTEFPI
jgi:hypothetical protein